MILNRMYKIGKVIFKLQHNIRVIILEKSEMYLICNLLKVNSNTYLVHSFNQSNYNMLDDVIGLQI